MSIDQYLVASEQTLDAIRLLLGSGVGTEATLEAIRVLLTGAATEPTLQTVATGIQSIGTSVTTGSILGEPTQRTAFGAVNTESLHPVAGWTFPFNQINTRLVTPTATGTGAAITIANGLASVACGTDSNGVASITTKKALRYVNGIGGRFVVAGRFTTGVANSTQLLGIGDVNDGLFFGFNGASFGINRRVSGVDNWIPQSSWDTNPATWATPLDPTKGNVYMISFQWLGFGELRFFIEDPAYGGFKLVHRIHYANANTTPSLRHPQLSPLAETRNSGNTTSLAIFTGSCMGFQEGNVNNVLSFSWCSEATLASITTEAAILTLRNDSTHNSTNNRARLHLTGLSFYGEGTGNNVVTYRIRRDCALGGSPSFVAMSATDSISSVDKIGTLSVAGSLMWSARLGRNNGDRVDLHELDIELGPGETLTVTAESATSITSNISLQWHEEW